ncbi:MAG: ATP-binding protein [Bacteroidota bacterium]
MPVIDTVPSQMRQVFQNLISNALKFSKEDVPPVVQITSEYLSDASDEVQGDPEQGQRCRITISDNGIGFDEKFTDRIFVIFQRLHTRDAYEGTGIGLAITKKIIERHNGTISASSRENEGTSFFIQLPLKNNQ